MDGTIQGPITQRRISLNGHFLRYPLEELSQLLEEKGVNPIAYNAVQLAQEAERASLYIHSIDFMSLAKIMRILELEFGRESVFERDCRSEITQSIGIIECGSGMPFIFDNKRCAALAYIFATGNIPNIPFFSYDPKVTQAYLKQNPQCFANERFTPEIKERAIAQVLDNFSELEGKVRTFQEERKTPVIISNHVLSAPKRWLGEQEFWEEYCFWKLPGFHIHNVSYDELGENRGVKGIQDVISGKDKKAHLDSLCKTFQINPLNINCYYDKVLVLARGKSGTPFEATYFWINR